MTCTSHRSSEGGLTYGAPTWIWCVAVNDAFYVRGYNGQNSSWYQAAMRQKAGRIIAAGMTKEVTFEPVDGPINNCVDDAYRAKYHGSLYLSRMIGSRPRAATVKVMPREIAQEFERDRTAVSTSHKNNEQIITQRQEFEK